MNPPAYLELDLPEVTSWLPEEGPGCPLENDAWIEREQALRYQPGQDRGGHSPVEVMFEM